MLIPESYCQKQCSEMLNMRYRILPTETNIQQIEMEFSIYSIWGRVTKSGKAFGCFCTELPTHNQLSTKISS